MGHVVTPRDHAVGDTDAFGFEVLLVLVHLLLDLTRIPAMPCLAAALVRDLRLKLGVQRSGTALVKQLAYLCRRELNQLGARVHPTLNLLSVDARRHLDLLIPGAGDRSAVHDLLR